MKQGFLIKCGMTPAHICENDSKICLESVKVRFDLCLYSICLQQKSSKYQFGKFPHQSVTVLMHIVVEDINSTSHPVFTDWKLSYIATAGWLGNPIEKTIRQTATGELATSRFSTETGPGNVQELQAKFGARQLSDQSFPENGFAERIPQHPKPGITKNSQVICEMCINLSGLLCDMNMGHEMSTVVHRWVDVRRLRNVSPHRPLVG